jgi:cytochrome c553
MSAPIVDRGVRPHRSSCNLAGASAASGVYLRGAGTVVMLLTAWALGASACHALETATGEVQDALRLAPNLVRGAQIFQTCAQCHGADGAGRPDGSVPALAGQHVSVVIKEVIDFRYNRRLEIPMQLVTADRHRLPRAQAIADVAAYVGSLPPARRSAAGSSASPARALYAERCESCHGASAEGDGAHFVPALAGQSAGYLARQIDRTRTGSRPNMAADHARLFAALSRAEIDAVAEYLSQLSTAGHTD